MNQLTIHSQSTVLHVVLQGRFSTWLNHGLQAIESHPRYWLILTEREVPVSHIPRNPSTPVTYDQRSSPGHRHVQRKFRTVRVLPKNIQKLFKNSTSRSWHCKQHRPTQSLFYRAKWRKSGVVANMGCHGISVDVGGPFPFGGVGTTRAMIPWPKVDADGRWMFHRSLGQPTWSANVPFAHGPGELCHETVVSSFIRPTHNPKKKTCDSL